MNNDIKANKILCLHCNHLHDIEAEDCSFCGSELFQRKPFANHLTWWYTITAAIFMIPANLLPMMTITSMGKVKYSTIFSGIIDFITDGSYGIALIIFTASIFVPIFKIVVLLFMLILTKVKSRKYAKIGVKLYKIVHFIGKWSMLDIFVVGIMISLVRYDYFISVDAGGALFAFSLVVILTILATKSMDPRLMFDHLDDYHSKS